MRTKKEIIDRIEWIKNALNDEDNATELMQVKLYAQLDILEWVTQGNNQRAK